MNKMCFTLALLYEKTNDKLYLEKIFIHLAKDTNLISIFTRWYKHNLIEKEEYILLYNRTLFKNIHEFLLKGNEFMTDSLCMIYELNSITDDIIFSLLSDSKNALEDSILILYLITPSLFHSTDCKRISDNLNKLTDSSIHSISTNEFFKLYLLNLSYYYSYIGIPISSLLSSFSNLIRKLVPSISKSTINKKSRTCSTINIGFFSTFLFQNHSVCRDRLGIIQSLCLDPAFTVYLITYNENQSELFNRIMRNTSFTKIIIPNFEAGFEIIEKLHLDILVYPEVGMDHGTYIMAHFRLAEIQINTWGHSETSGISTIDYFVSSSLYETEQAQDNYSEKLYCMKSLCTYYYNIGNVYTETQPVHQLKNTYEFFSSNRIYGILQNQFKYHTNTLYIIKQLLIQDETAIVVILGMKNIVCKQYIESHLGFLCSRIRFYDKMSMPDYCDLIRTMDILIDSYPFGGCNSTLDAFYLKKIVMTCPSTKLNGRFTFGFYNKMGITEPICNTLDELVTRSIYYAHHIDERIEIEEKIKTQSYHLFEEFQSMVDWNQWLRSLKGLTMPEKPHLIISHYKEDISFLSQYDFPTTIYHKGGELENALPNIGKCDHTYLHHIITHYHELPELLVFLPASFYHISKKRTLAHQVLYKSWVSCQTTMVGDYTVDLCKQNEEFQLDEWKSSLEVNKGLDILEPSPIRPFGKWYRHLFGDTLCQTITWFGILAVTRKDIHRHPISFYEKLLEFVMTPNPEAGHYIERSWAIIFPDGNRIDNKYVH